MMTGVIIQNDFSTVETRAIKQHCIANDIQFVCLKLDRLDYNDGFLDRNWMPVGSVEFVQMAFKCLLIKQPEFDCYDDVLGEYFFKREIYICPGYLLESILKPSGLFVKPIQTKRFNGFVFKGFDYEGYDDHDKVQLATLGEFRLSEKVYISEVVNFVAEWRVYVLNNKVIGQCRYDENEEEYCLDLAFTCEAIEKLGDRTVALDIGLLDTGEYAVVELNDAWACGKYKEISNADYYRFLRTRWDEIIA